MARWCDLKGAAVEKNDGRMKAVCRKWKQMLTSQVVQNVLTDNLLEIMATAGETHATGPG